MKQARTAQFYRTLSKWLFKLFVAALVLSAVAAVKSAVDAGVVERLHFFFDRLSVKANGDWLTFAVQVVPLLTVVLGFIGFLVANALAWSKELRERKQSELDLEKKTLEIEKLRRELRD